MAWVHVDLFSTHASLMVQLSTEVFKRVDNGVECNEGDCTEPRKSMYQRRLVEKDQLREEYRRIN